MREQEVLHKMCDFYKDTDKIPGDREAGRETGRL